MAFIAADSYHSTIATIAGGTGITSFTVTSASGFPALAAGDQTVMRLDDAGTAEDVTCTGISGTTVTCIATTSAHAAGNTIDGAILTTGALAQIKDDAHSGFPVNAFTGAGALVKGTGVRNHGTVTAAACTMTLANGTYTGELCRVSIDRTSTKQVTVDPAGATLWDGVSTIALFAGDNIIGAWDGTGWITLEKFSSFATPGGQLLIANNFYFALNTSLAASAVFSTTVTRYTPIFIPYPITISQLGAKVITTSAGGNFVMAIYANGANNQAAGAPLQQTGNMSTATSAIVMGALGANLQLQGYYWVATQMDNATATLGAINVISATEAAMMGVATATNLSGTSNQSGTAWTATSTYGTFATNPVITESTNTSSQQPVPIYKVASVP